MGEYIDVYIMPIKGIFIRWMDEYNDVYIISIEDISYTQIDVYMRNMYTWGTLRGEDTPTLRMK